MFNGDGKITKTFNRSRFALPKNPTSWLSAAAAKKEQNNWTMKNNLVVWVIKGWTLTLVFCVSDTKLPCWLSNQYVVVRGMLYYVCFFSWLTWILRSQDLISFAMYATSRSYPSKKHQSFQRLWSLESWNSNNIFRYTCRSIYTPRKLSWNPPKMVVFVGVSPFERGIFRFHVSFGMDG